MTVTRNTGGAYAVADAGVDYQVDAMTGLCNCPKGRKGGGCVHTQAVLSFIANSPAERHTLDKTTPADKKSTLTKLGYPLGVVTSAMQKEIRRADVEAAVYWGTLLFDRSPHYAWKRVLVTAAEDVGFANVPAVRLTCELAQAWRLAKENAWYVTGHHLTMAIMALCGHDLTPTQDGRSTEVEDLQTWTLDQIKRGVKRPILECYIDGHTAQGKAVGKTWDEWYRDRHVTFGIPVNSYTWRIWECHPEWCPEEFKAALAERRARGR
jgi:hypothetical protein